MNTAVGLVNVGWQGLERGTGKGHAARQPGAWREASLSKAKRSAAVTRRRKLAGSWWLGADQALEARLLQPTRQVPQVLKDAAPQYRSPVGSQAAGGKPPGRPLRSGGACEERPGGETQSGAGAAGR